MLECCHLLFLKTGVIYLSHTPWSYWWIAKQRKKGQPAFFTLDWEVQRSVFFISEYPLWSCYRILSDKKKVFFFPCFLLNSFNLFFSFSLTVLEFKKLFWHLMLPVLTPAIGAVYNCALNINLIFTSLA